MKPRNHSTGITLPSSVLIDPRTEPLKPILSPYRGITHVPSELDGAALAVFIELTRCFKKAGKVSEGLLANVIWGFEQCGLDPRLVAGGLTALRHKGYVFYSDATGLPISEQNFDPNVPIWIRYGKKFLDLMVRNDAGGILFKEDGTLCKSST